MSKPQPRPELPPLDPELIWEDSWQRLEIGASKARHPFHLGVFATAHEGVPDLRTVVLRAVSRHPYQLTFHTDQRSPKAQGLQRPAPTSWLFYDSVARIQLRIACHTQTSTLGEQVDERWEQSRLQSRACYRHTHAPSTPIEAPFDYQPAPPPPGEQEHAGREHFAIAVSTVTRLDWLCLHHQGHRRLQFTVTSRGIDSAWLAP